MDNLVKTDDHFFEHIKICLFVGSLTNTERSTIMMHQHQKSTGSIFEHAVEMHLVNYNEDNSNFQLIHVTIDL